MPIVSRRRRLLTRLGQGRFTRPSAAFAAVTTMLASVVLAGVLSGTSPAAAVAPAASQLQAQVLTWTAGDSFQAYASVPTTATAGPTTIVFENSAATGNTTGMQHTLTFDTGDPRYNSDVNVNIIADPSDANGGRHTVDVTLTPGTYRFFCAIPGHGQMTGLLVVTGDGGDTTAPEVTAQVAGDRDDDGNYVGAATVTVNATDAGSGVARIEYALDGGPFGTYSAPVTVNSPGAHTVQYRATDEAGNTSTIGSSQFTVVAVSDPDTTAPTVTAAVDGDQDENGAYLGSATVTVTASDTESGVASVEYSLDGGAFAAYTAPVTVNTTGAHTVQYRATDVAGNTSSAQSLAFTVVDPPNPDNTAPVVTTTVAGEKDDDGAYVDVATVTVAATDEGSGVASIEYSLDGAPYSAYTAPFAVNQRGVHTVSARATDEAGNTSTPTTVQFTVAEGPAGDNTPPTVTASVAGDQNEQGAYVGSATVTVTATDAESGVDTVEYAVDGGAWTAYTAPVTVTATGSHTLTFRATDEAGNTSTPGNVQFAVADAPNPDQTAPTANATVAGNRDSTGAYVGAATVTVTASDADSGVATVEYSLDGAPYATYTAPVSVNQPGSHTVSYRATDRAGNTSTPAGVEFRVVSATADTTPPTVNAAISGQLNSSWAYVGSATVTLTSSDAGTGVLRTEYAVNAGGYLVYTAPVTINTPGTYTFTYRATDRAGNVSSTASATFVVVESVPPPPSCRVADNRATVWMGTLNTAVANRVVEGGCSINDLVLDESPWASAAEFVDHVTALADRWHQRSLIPLKDRNGLVRGARESNVGRSEAVQGYAPLLDTKAASFKLWEQVGAGGFRRNADGSITSKQVDGLGMLWFPVRTYGDFSLKLQWRDDAAGTGRANSGVFVRFPQVHQHPQEPRPEWVAIKYGHELQIFDSPTGDQYKSGSVYGFDQVDLADAGVTAKGTWNDYEIRVVGQHYSIFRNGKLINQFTNGPGQLFNPPRADDPGTDGRQNAEGYIGLQNHSAADTVSFRNIRIAPLTP
ncbi:family 16 glycoside hydrolase [Asanoa sp. NPDC049518]|uniref:OmpL47-type beta-barrel domain-containing protein n=1 Tax=unclassified Asanoa TaxID=2685164 RepID=UPI00341C0A50